MQTNILNYIKAGIILLLLIFGLVFVLTYTHIVHCKTIGQSWCNIYWRLVGPPRILVVFGDDGLGNAERLMTILSDRQKFNLRVQRQYLDHIPTLSYLEKYNMVIVTQARTMSSDKIRMFFDYANRGGILVWTGDAGVVSQPHDKKPSDYNISGTNPWTRVTKDGQIIFFSNLLSVEYIDNFCSYVNCASLSQDFVGYLKQDPDSPIAAGIPPNTPLHGDFALTVPVYNTTTVVDISVDYGSNLIGKDPKDKKGLGNYFPLMVRSQLGKNVIYLAAPIEYLVQSSDPTFKESNTETNIPTTIRKMFEEYFGVGK